MSGQPKQSEYTVRVPKKNSLKRYSILKFNGSFKIDTGKWVSPTCTIRMFREDNKNQNAVSENKQDYGEGSEYGKAAREEARRKKYGRQVKAYKHDNQPWRLNISDSDGKERKFRSIREGGAGEHADYWVFFKSGEEFHAIKIQDWYQFLPCITHRTLDIDQAEERFQQRNRVMNQFALKAQIQQQLKAMEEDGEQIVKSAKTLKIKDEMSSDESDEGEDGEQSRGDDDSFTKKPKKDKKSRPHDDKKQRVKSADEIAAYESDDGDDEGREYDYMSDSGSESDRDAIPMEQKVDEAMVAVGDEVGLKKLIGDDLSDSESSDDEDDTTKKLLRAAEGDDDEKKKRFNDIDERDSSGSDSDDPDKEVNSALFLPVKKVVEDSDVSTRKRPNEDDNDIPPKKAKAEEETATTTTPSDPAVVEGLNEETVRRYLRRKPHTTKELLSKIKSKCGDMEKSEIVQKLAAILKRIEPHQFKQKHGKKEVLFFSLSNTLA